MVTITVSTPASDRPYLLDPLLLRDTTERVAHVQDHLLERVVDYVAVVLAQLPAEGRREPVLEETDNRGDRATAAAAHRRVPVADAEADVVLGVVGRADELRVHVLHR